MQAPSFRNVMSWRSAFAVLIIGALVAIALSATPARADSGSGNPDARQATESGAPESRAARGPRPKYGGTPPMWVVHPYLVAKGNRLAIEAQVYVDPFRRPSAPEPGNRRLAATPDKLVVRVTVAKKRYANPRKARAVSVLPRHALLTDVRRTVRVDRRGVVRLSVRLDARTSRELRALSFAQRQAAVSVIVSHLKDTYEAKPNSPRWGMTQTNDAALQRSKASAGERARLIRVAKRQIITDLRRINVVRKPRPEGRWAGDSPMFNYVYVTNSTPFEQQINFNPNIQCMWTGSAKQYPTAQVATVPSGGILQMAYVMEPNPYVGGMGTTWAGLNGATTGMNAPGTQQTLTGDLVNASAAAGQYLLDAVGNSENYNEAGAAATVGGAAISFLETFFLGVNESGTCSADTAEYPETFALTTTVTGFGPKGEDNAWDPSSTTGSYTAPNTWMVTPPIPAPQNTQYWADGGQVDPDPSVLPSAQCVGQGNASGQNCYWTGSTTVGSQTANTTVTDCVEPSQNSSPGTWCQFVYGALQPMLGAQTAATYYWNGGQPAYMVSNNATAGSFTGGSASFQGGLFQNVGPNPGLPGDAWCWGADLVGVINCSYMNATDASELANYNPMGAMNIQLTYLTTPQYTSGLYTGLSAGASGQPAPTVNVQAGTSATGEPGINVTCDLSNIQPYLSLPFAAGGAKTTVISGTQLLNTSVNSAGTKPTGSWAVNFYGLDKDGNFVYYNPSPGTAPAMNASETATSASIYALGPNASSTTASFNATSQQYPTGFVPNAVLDNMQTIANMNSGSDEIATLAAVGCSVVPSIAMSGLDITGSNAGVSAVFGQINAQGNGWPMPGNHTGWPSSLYTPYNSYTNYAWQTPVEQVNVSFQGMPVVATTSVTCTQTSCSPSS